MMPAARGCGSCDQCKEYKARQAVDTAKTQAERQDIHVAKLAALQRLTLAGDEAKTQRRARKAREKMCRTTPPRGHIYEATGCVGCGKLR
jgi:hypothetical protein